MELNVGVLKTIINELPDDVILADLSNPYFFRTYDWIKRLVLLKDAEGKTYLTIVDMGSHYTGEGHQEGLSEAGQHWDANNTSVKENDYSTLPV